MYFGPQRAKNRIEFLTSRLSVIIIAIISGHEDFSNSRTAGDSVHWALIYEHFGRRQQITVPRGCHAAAVVYLGNAASR